MTVKRYNPIGIPGEVMQPDECGGFVRWADYGALEQSRAGVPHDDWYALCNERDLLLKAIDDLGVAIADAGYAWTPAMRDAYERGTRNG